MKMEKHLYFCCSLSFLHRCLWGRPCSLAPPVAVRRTAGSLSLLLGFVSQHHLQHPSFSLCFHFVANIKWEMKMVRDFFSKRHLSYNKGSDIFLGLNKHRSHSWAWIQAEMLNEPPQRGERGGPLSPDPQRLDRPDGMTPHRVFSLSSSVWTFICHICS